MKGWARFLIYTAVTLGILLALAEYAVPGAGRMYGAIFGSIGMACLILWPVGCVIEWGRKRIR
jgi:hypothetical protein